MTSGTLTANGWNCRAGGISIVFDGSEAQVSGLKDWGRYYFSVRAVNGAGVSEWSEYNMMNNPG